MDMLAAIKGDRTLRLAERDALLRIQARARQGALTRDEADFVRATYARMTSRAEPARKGPAAPATPTTPATT